MGLYRAPGQSVPDRLWIKRTAGTARDKGRVKGSDKGPDRGRPSPGGEEARVVVYQPRGVGLMHTRLRPSESDYTHGIVPPRKSPGAQKTTILL